MKFPPTNKNKSPGTIGSSSALTGNGHQRMPVAQNTGKDTGHPANRHGVEKASRSVGHLVAIAVSRHPPLMQNGDGIGTYNSSKRKTGLQNHPE